MLWKTVTLPSLYITISAWQAPSLQCLVANMEERKALWCCDFPWNQHTDDEVNIYKSQTGAEQIANLPIHKSVFGKTTGKIRYYEIICSIFHQMAKWVIFSYLLRKKSQLNHNLQLPRGSNFFVRITNHQPPTSSLLTCPVTCQMPRNWVKSTWVSTSQNPKTPWNQPKSPTTALRNSGYPPNLYESISKREVRKIMDSNIPSGYGLVPRRVSFRYDSSSTN